MLFRPVYYWTGNETREGYLERVMGSYWQAMQSINELPPDSEVLLLWEPRSYYAYTTTYPDAILDRWAHLFHLYRTPDAIAAALQEEGITHILVFVHGMNAVRQDTEIYQDLPAERWEALDAFLAIWLTPVAKMDNYVLYTWK